LEIYTDSLLNFRVVCKKFGVSFPIVCSREKEHLSICVKCRETWPMYWYRECFVNNRDLVDVSNDWSNMTEATREDTHKHLRREHRKWITKMTKLHIPSGYQIFIRDRQFTAEQKSTIDFKDRTQIVGKDWLGLSQEIRDLFTSRSSQLKQERIQLLKSLPRFKKLQYDHAKRRKKILDRQYRPERACNSFLLYMKDRWTDEQRKPGQCPSYRSVMTSTATEWKNMSVSDKRPYTARMEAQKERIKSKYRTTAVENDAVDDSTVKQSEQSQNFL
jgi:hypothetical protein